MTWAQDQRIAWIKDRLENGEKVNRSDIVEKFIVTKQTATATMHKFRDRHPNSVVYDGRTKAFWAPDKAPSVIDWKARAEAAEAKIEALKGVIGKYRYRTPTIMRALKDTRTRANLLLADDLPKIDAEARALTTSDSPTGAE